MNNENYQEKVVEFNFSGRYQGDIVSSLIVNLVKRYIRSPVLDIGAGSGALINNIKNKNYTATGIDLFPRDNEIQKGTITNLKFKDNEFNTIFCTEVIEHLTNNQIDKGLSEIKRVLKKNGHFIVTVPYNESLEKNTFTCPKCGHKFHKVGHLQSFTKERIEKVFIENGFKIELINIYPVTIMPKVPLARIYWRFIMLFDKRFAFNKTILIVARLNV